MTESDYRVNDFEVLGWALIKDEKEVEPVNASNKYVYDSGPLGQLACDHLTAGNVFDNMDDQRQHFKNKVQERDDLYLAHLIDRDKVLDSLEQLNEEISEISSDYSDSRANQVADRIQDELSSLRTKIEVQSKQEGE